ncbi:phosphatase PAP2 family protein [Burkholderia sp. FERM BP-3421]|uniref:phosphatase PAP2 family protein n=1 Tax=Burkholderia sp. FERM BP-3421 TaxID=1494466 RepID=UPI00235F15CC|nr:phosphatase PAP2 family protein [Burkholderia sp. FERM BP-3421]WDD93689.1 phosphatase PAP2 family protein [Burkholderia sp. FERM BP-3421]
MQVRQAEVRAMRVRSGWLAAHPYAYGWGVVAAIVACDLLWLRAGGYAVQRAGVVAALKLIGTCIGFAVLLVGVARVARYRELAERFRYREVAEALFATALLAAFMAATGVLSYLCVSVNPPLIDAALIRADAWLGFDWPRVFAWVQARPQARQVLAFAYDSAKWQLIVIPFLLAVLRDRGNLRAFVWLFMLSGMMVLAVSTPWPAASAFVHFGVSAPDTADTVADFARLRAGSLHEIDLLTLQGLVSMPSFHTALGVIFAYALRRARGVSIVALGLNALMIASTPTQGGHYLVDVISGAVVAGAAIALVRSGGLDGRRQAQG